MQTKRQSAKTQIDHVNPVHLTHLPVRSLSLATFAVRMDTGADEWDEIKQPATVNIHPKRQKRKPWKKGGREKGNLR